MQRFVLLCLCHATGAQLTRVAVGASGAAIEGSLPRGKDAIRAAIAARSEELASCASHDACTRADRQRILRTLAAHHALLHDHSAAVDSLQSAMDLGYGTTRTTSAILDDLYMIAVYALSAGRSDDAFEHVESALGRSLNATARHDFLFLQSAVFECQGRFVEALDAVEQTMRPRAAAASANWQASYDELRRYYEVTRLLELASAEAASAPSGAIDKLQEMEAAMLDALMGMANTSGWEQPRWALPAQCDATISPPVRPSRPWRSLTELAEEHGVEVATIQELMRSSRADLLSEYERLRDQKALHIPEGLASVCAGYDRRFRRRTWEQYSIEGKHVPLDQSATGVCSSETPVACALLHELRTTHGLRVVRAGYSVVKAGGVGLSK